MFCWQLCFVLSSLFLLRLRSLIVQLYYKENKVNVDDMIRMSTLNYSNTLSWIFIKQQQFPGKHVAQLRHIILIPCQPYQYVLFGEAANTNFIVLFCLTRPFLELKIYNIRGTHNNNYYIDRCELWGFIREINSGISHVKYQFFSRLNYFYTTISVVVTSLVVLRWIHIRL